MKTFICTAVNGLAVSIIVGVTDLQLISVDFWIVMGCVGIIAASTAILVTD